MDQDGGVYNAGLSNAVTATGECYEDIGRLYDDQPRLDWEHLGDMMHDYKGLLSGWPAILQIHSVTRPCLLHNWNIRMEMFLGSDRKAAGSGRKS